MNENTLFTTQMVRQLQTLSYRTFFLLKQNDISNIPEIPEGAFAGRQSGQRGKYFLQNQLPMLLIT